MRRCWPARRLQPDTRHEFAVDHPEPVAAIRLDAFPDGGLSRVRAIGSIDPLARKLAGYRWFNALPMAQAVRVLTAAGVAMDAAAAIAAARPLAAAPAVTAAAPAMDAAVTAIDAVTAIVEGRHRSAGQ